MGIVLLAFAGNCECGFEMEYVTDLLGYRVSQIMTVAGLKDKMYKTWVRGLITTR